VDAGDAEALREELGDLALQVVFHAALARREKAFDIDDVMSEICAKLIRRHPHVFGDVEVEGAQGVLRNWEQIKREEKESMARERAPREGRAERACAAAQACRRMTRRSRSAPPNAAPRAVPSASMACARAAALRAPRGQESRPDRLRLDRTRGLEKSGEELRECAKPSSGDTKQSRGLAICFSRW
jgi:hypothetical protein